MRDVPAQRLAYRFEPDVGVPPDLKEDTENNKIEAIQLDFNMRRTDDALLRTVPSPDGQRALVLYSIDDEPSQSFHIDLYSSDGKFLRNVTPPDLACIFPEAVAWSPDGHLVSFIGHKKAQPSPSPTPDLPVREPEPELNPSPLPSVAPAFPSIPVFNTEQIYVCDRDGFGLRPLTSREGLIYFYLAWAPDAHAIVALACRESEWDAREKQFKLPVGRPRLITLEGDERLLDDELTEALPVWSPDASKVATAFDTDVMIYDAATNKPTQARIRLRDQLIKASRAYDEKASGKQSEDGAQNTNEGSAKAGSENAIPASFNPAIRLEWPAPEKLYLQTAYIRLMPRELITTFQRWHLLTLSPQAALLR